MQYNINVSMNIMDSIKHTIINRQYFLYYAGVISLNRIQIIHISIKQLTSKSFNCPLLTNL